MLYKTFNMYCTIVFITFISCNMDMVNSFMDHGDIQNDRSYSPRLRFLYAKFGAEKGHGKMSPSSPKRPGTSASGSWYLRKLGMARPGSRFLDVHEADVVKDVSRGSALKRRVRHVSALENFRHVYIDFRRDLENFLDLLPMRLKLGTQLAVQDVKSVATYMSPDDDDFTEGDLDGILRKFSVIYDMTNILLDYVHHFVLEEHLHWLENESNKLRWHLNILSFTIFSLRIDGSDSEISAVPGGIGGVNTGVN